MIDSVAYLSVHTSPLLQPGTGDAGGMNVYIDELARTMSGRGIAVDVYVRKTDPAQEAEVVVSDGYRVRHIEAGPAEPLSVDRLWPHIGRFAQGVLDRNTSYDVVHSHYWLSGWAGVIVKERLGIPMANSFHTLGRVKDLTRRPDEPPSSETRIITEAEVIAQSDCVIASTDAEADDLLTHYDASPERLCVSPPGINHEVFKPGDRGAARTWLGLAEEPIVLFVGRIQPLKGIDIAIEAVSKLEDAHLVAVGGPSGPAGHTEAQRARDLVDQLGFTNRCHFVPPQPHYQLAEFYRAADILLVPSRSESFGLVAAEAQACGLPVVAARTGGLPHVVSQGESGILIDGWNPADYTDAIQRILDDRDLEMRLSTGAVRYSERFSWPATAERLLELYAGIIESSPPSS